jgi:hypothetical protein
MADPLATVEQVQTILGDDDVDAERVRLLIDVASANVRRYTGQHLSAVSGDEYTTNGSDGQVIFLPQLPVTAIVSVSVDGAELTDDEYEWDAYGVVERVAGSWSAKRRGIVVRYSHGYSDVPDDIVGVVAATVGAMLDNPAGVRSEQIGSYRVTYGEDPDGFFPAAAREILDGYRLVKV